MSVPVDVAAVPAEIARLGPRAFIVSTSDDGSPHVASVLVTVDGDHLAMSAGRRSRANAAARPSVTLVWPDADGGDHCLLVDGTAQPEPSEALVVLPTSAVLHRLAGESNDRPAPGPSAGVAFEDGPDRGRVVIGSADTHGAYSLMEWTIASRSEGGAADDDRDFGAHAHADIEEVFVVRRGAIDFLVGDDVTTLRANDTCRVPPGTRHGYVNRTGRDAEMTVIFSPGGFEELFVKYRTDQPSAPGEGFVAEARRLFATEFEA